MDNKIVRINQSTIYVIEKYIVKKEIHDWLMKIELKENANKIPDSKEEGRRYVRALDDEWCDSFLEGVIEEAQSYLGVNKDGANEC